MTKSEFGGKYKGKGLGDGECTYCKKYRPLVNDHALPRSTFPEQRTNPDNLVPCCWVCNGRREDTTWKPKFITLPPKTRALVSSYPIGRTERYFDYD